jgi:hypothetical protein
MDIFTLQFLNPSTSNFREGSNTNSLDISCAYNFKRSLSIFFRQTSVSMCRWFPTFQGQCLQHKDCYIECCVVTLYVHLRDLCVNTPSEHSTRHIESWGLKDTPYNVRHQIHFDKTDHQRYLRCALMLIVCKLCRMKRVTDIALRTPIWNLEFAK